MTVLIPAYEPNERLINLIYKLKAICEYNIVIVNDGSVDEFNDIFTRVSNIGCTVLRHETNKGKGQALKTGFKYIMDSSEREGVVTADCDGQHLPQDIVKVAEEIKNHNKCIILGTRRFIGKVPLLSRFGNSLTRTIFSFANGEKIYDTQTGLRGFSKDMLEWLYSVSGERFEYEMNMLLEARSFEYGFYEVDINTVYLQENKSSHFHPLKDSIKVYMPIVKFSISSILSAIIDFSLLGIIQAFTSNLFISVIGARLCSAVFNYTMNRAYVFSKSKNSAVRKSLPRYFLLAVVIILVNYSVIDIFYQVIGLSLFLAKIFTEVTIYLLSFWSQRKFVFKN